MSSWNRAIAGLVLMCGGLAAGEFVRPPLDYKANSRTLHEALRKAIAEVIKDTEKEVKQPDLPAGKTEAEAIEEVIAQYRAGGVLLVTRSEEALLGANKFDDKLNRDCLETQLETLEEQGSNVTVLVSYFINKFNRDALAGLELELAVRVIQFDISRAKREKAEAERRKARAEARKAAPAPASQQTKR